MIVWDESGNRREINNDFIDLGLPSGTLWCYTDIYRTNKGSKFKDYVSSFYHISLIPTKSQFLELSKFCSVKKYYDFYLFTSKINNNKLILFDGYYKTFDRIINIDEILFPDSLQHYGRHFLCLRLVKKNKNELS